MIDGHTNELTGVRFLRIKNDSGEAIPPFAAVRITGVVAGGDSTTEDSAGAVTVEKPDADGQTDLIAFAGPHEIPADQEGYAIAEWPAVARCREADTAPAFGDTWGTQSGQWALRKGNVGFRVVANERTEAGEAHFARVIRVQDVSSALEVVEPRPGSTGSSGSGTQLQPYRIAVPVVATLTFSAGEDILFWDANDS